MLIRDRMKVIALFMRQSASVLLPVLSPLYGSLAQNQGITRIMRVIEARRVAMKAGGAKRASTIGMTVISLMGLLIAFILAVYWMAAAGLGQPAGLALLALLAVVGAFFSFGFLAGFVKLQESAHDAELARSVAEAAETAFQVLAADGSVVYGNAAFQAIFGTSSKSVEQALAADPRAGEAVYRLARAAERLEERVEDVPVREFRARTSTQPGMARSVRWLRIGVRPFVPSPTIPDNRRMTLWTCIDITGDRARELDAITGLEHSLSFYDSMPVGLFVVQQDGRLGQVNQTLGVMLGLRGDPSRLGWSVADICPPEVATLIMSLRAASVAVTQRFDVDLVREDGRSLPVRLVCCPSDRNDAMTVLVFDRSTDEQPHDSVRAVTERFQRVFHGAPFAIATLDKQGGVVSANAAFVRLCGEYADGALHGSRPVLDLIMRTSEPEQRRAVEAGIQRVVSGRATAAPFEISMGGDQTSTRRIYLNPLTSSSDPREAAVLYMLDTTEISALELKFAQSQKLETLGRLAGGVAHDINNVLTIIIGLSDLLLQSRRPTDPGYTDIMQIKSNANRAAGTVGKLLAYSRKQTLKPEILELNDVIQDLGFSLNRLLGEKVNVLHKSGRDLWYVKADRTQFEQSLVNLSLNARDAMPGGGNLVIRTRNVSVRDSMKLANQNVLSGEYVLIEVEDSGTGMSPEVAAKVFEPFFTTKDIGKGTGLGLASVYGIIKQTGGYIFCDSALGKGTTFRIYLPRHVPTLDETIARDANEERKKEPPRDLSGTGRVLLVEDEDNLRSMAMRALTRQGYQVLEASTGLEALEIMDREGGNIDLVLSDVIMPEMDGPTMLREMRKSKPDTRIIFMSGYPSDAFEKGLGTDESFAFLQKPFALPQLAQLVKEQLGK